MACWPTTVHTQIIKLKKAEMGTSPGITGMELPFPSPYAPHYLLPKWKYKHSCLRNDEAWPSGHFRGGRRETSWHYLLLIFAYSSPPPPPPLKGCGLSTTSGLHRWLESLWEPLCRVRQWKQKMMLVRGLSTGLWTLPNGMFFSKEHSGCK